MDRNSKLQLIAQEYHKLASRFSKYADRDVKPRHLATNIHASAIQSGRLFVDAIDNRAFPNNRSKENCGWWDRTIGRLPGSVFTVYGGVSWRHGEPLPGDKPEYKADAAKFFDAVQHARLWTWTVKWLTGKFLDRFQHNAGACDWECVAIRNGRLVGMDGRCLEHRNYRNGKRLPDDFRITADMPDGRYELGLSGEPANESDFFDDADWLARHRNRAEVYSDACQLLAELIHEGLDALVKSNNVDMTASEPSGAVETLLLRAMSSSPLRGRVLARNACVKFNSHAKNALAGLVKQGRCKNKRGKGGGYYVEPKSGEKVRTGQD